MEPIWWGTLKGHRGPVSKKSLGSFMGFMGKLALTAGMYPNVSGLEKEGPKQYEMTRGDGFHFMQE